MIDNWAAASGLFLINTGRDLRELEPRLLYEVGYYLISQLGTLYKEQHEAMEKIDDSLRDLIWQEETGLPAIAQFMPPADGSPINPR